LLCAAWKQYRQAQLHREYFERRERYDRLTGQRGTVYREDDVVAQARSRMALRGYTPGVRKSGDVHTFAFIPRIGWHTALVHDLKELGTVTEFDPGRGGFTWQDLYRQDGAFVERRRAINDLFVRHVLEAHARNGVDWIFVYASGLEIRADTMRAITEQTGVPVVCMCLDDKQSWTGPAIDQQRLGQIDIASTFDLCWTSARIACEWYLAEGAAPVYMPEGFDAQMYRPLPVKQDLPVSFIGGAYGFRPDVVRYLREHLVSIQPFGPDWGTGPVWGEDQVNIINRSVINLGMGGIGYSETLTNVKTRDFEIPGTGGGVYLTSYNADLAQHFVIGKEILCYGSRDEMLELIRYYLRHEDEARLIAVRGRQRCLREHRWLHRYKKLCRLLGIIADEGQDDCSHTSQVTRPGQAQ
jgi:hypothetical protein